MVVGYLLLGGTGAALVDRMVPDERYGSVEGTSNHGVYAYEIRCSALVSRAP
jgi:hypothetical protein